jgi:hypothetical protein
MLSSAREDGSLDILIMTKVALVAVRGALLALPSGAPARGLAGLRESDEQVGLGVPVLSDLLGAPNLFF